LRPATLADAADIARVRIESWRATYRGLIPDAYVDGMQVDASTAIWERVLSAATSVASVFVVAHDATVVGFAAGNRLAEPKYDLDAELSAVYLRPDYQRAGLGHRCQLRRQHQRPLPPASSLDDRRQQARRAFTSSSAGALVEQPFRGRRGPDKPALAGTACGARLRVPDPPAPQI
jgi:GNAT superfamily N-acetyltransferase